MSISSQPTSSPAPSPPATVTEGALTSSPTTATGTLPVPAGELNQDVGSAVSDDNNNRIITAAATATTATVSTTKSSEQQPKEEDHQQTIEIANNDDDAQQQHDDDDKHQQIPYHDDDKKNDKNSNNVDRSIRDDVVPIAVIEITNYHSNYDNREAGYGLGDHVEGTNSWDEIDDHKGNHNDNNDDDERNVIINTLLLEGNKYDDEYAWERDPFAGSPESKYERYELPVAHDKGDRAMDIKLWSCQRPHMRGLHCAWISFFLAFTVWFAPAPLLKEIGSTLHLTKQQLWTSSITNDITSIVMRIIIGPICDQYGARIPMAVVLISSSIPCSMVGLVNTGAGLAVIRFFIGIAGCSFVMSQYWPSRMFSREIAGTANGIVGGWGNFGGAFTQLFMGRILFPLFKHHVYNGNPEPAWRLICIFPAFMAFAWGCIVWRISDDAPVGNYSKMRKAGTMDRIYFTGTIRQGVKLNTLILYIQYACCFGVEIVMNNGAVLYFIDQFGLSTEDASSLAFAYGSMNLLFRGAGGFLSDALNLRNGLRGRLWLQTLLLLLEGVIIIVFSYAKTLPGAIISMIVFSVFTQSSEGAIFGVVPYVSKLYTGSVSGIVGSGGNMGSVVYGFLFRNLPYRQAFLYMGSLVMASSILSIWINIPCHASMLWGEDNFAVINSRTKFMARRNRDNVERGVHDYGPDASTSNDNNHLAETTTTITNNNNHDNTASNDDNNDGKNIQQPEKPINGLVVDDGGDTCMDNDNNITSNGADDTIIYDNNSRTVSTENYNVGGDANGDNLDEGNAIHHHHQNAGSSAV